MFLFRKVLQYLEPTLILVDDIISTIKKGKRFEIHQLKFLSKPGMPKTELE
jgi:hypothetical protein